MRCPTCRKPLQSQNIGDVLIDECRQCRGIWFDPGELEEVKNKVDPDLRFMDIDMWRAQAQFNIMDTKLICPKCEDPFLQQLSFQKPRIDFTLCSCCEGIWLDPKNLQNILDALGQEAESKNVSEYLKIGLKEASEIFANPEKLVSEWKDLAALLRLLQYRFFAENQKLRSILVGIQKSLPL